MTVAAITGGRYKKPSQRYLLASNKEVLVPTHQLSCFGALITTLNITHIAHGCAIGTDTHVSIFVRGTFPDVTLLRFPVDVEIDGPWPTAGHKRNRRMLKESGASILIAFPGGSGTANCTSEALVKWLAVWEWAGNATNETGRFELISAVSVG